MSFWDNLAVDAKQVFGLLAKAGKVSAQVDLPSSLKAIEDLVKEPKQALVNGSLQTVLYSADDILAGLALIPEPDQPAVAIAAAALRVMADEEPDIAAGATILFSSGKIPQVTLDLESTIEERFGR